MTYRTDIVDGMARIAVPAEAVTYLPDGTVAFNLDPDEARWAGWHLTIVAWAAGGRMPSDDDPREVRVSPGLDHAVRVSVNGSWADIPLGEAEELRANIATIMDVQRNHIAAGTRSSATLTIPYIAP